jgi:hypothetical protein
MFIVYLKPSDQLCYEQVTLLETKICVKQIFKTVESVLNVICVTVMVLSYLVCFSCCIRILGLPAEVRSVTKGLVT